MLSYTGQEIDERLKKINDLNTNINTLNEALDKFGGTIEVTADAPTKENTVLTINPDAEDIGIYTATEVDAMITNLSDKMDELEVGGGGATEEQIQQIEKNKNDISNLSKEIDDHKNDGTIHVTATEKQTWNGKVDKTGISLDKHTDGLIYIFVNGEKVGNGVEVTGEVVEGDIIGNFDEDNNILLSGDIADGTYTLKYLNGANEWVDYGKLTVSAFVNYTITQNLTNVISNSTTTSIREGNSFTADLTANNGYNMSSIKVTMGGTDITSTAVSGGTINIASVTGDVVITAVAIEDIPELKGNLADPTSSYWKNGYRLSISGGNTSVLDGHTTTNFIPAKAGDVLRVKGMAIASSDGGSDACKIVMYSRKDDESSKLGGLYGQINAGAIDSYGDNVVVDGDVSTLTVLMKKDGTQVATSSCAYIRIDGFLINGYTAEDVIITINEEIEETEPEIVNLIPLSTNTDGTPYESGKGYKTGYKISVSGGGESSSSGIEVTGFIPVSYGDTLYLKGITFASSGSNDNYCFYDSNKSRIAGGNWYLSFKNGVQGEAVSVAIKDMTLNQVVGDINNVAFIRISATTIDDSSIITKNQPIE